MRWSQTINRINKNNLKGFRVLHIELITRNSFGNLD